jgi:hypothetical protein
MTAALDRFGDSLPADAVDVSDGLYRYAAAGVVPQCVLSPSSVADVAAAVGAARAGNLAIIPAGHPTHLDVGSPPPRYDAALSTRRLDRILAHEAADMTVTVEAGVTLKALAGVRTVPVSYQSLTKDIKMVGAGQSLVSESILNVPAALGNGENFRKYCAVPARLARS